MEVRGNATRNSGYSGKAIDGIATTSAPNSSDGPPLGAKIMTSSPFRLRHSTVLASIVTMPSIFGRNDSVTIATFNYAVSL